MYQTRERVEHQSQYEPRYPSQHPSAGRPGLIRRILLGEVLPSEAEPPQGRAPGPSNGSQDVIDVRPITEPDISMIYLRLERLETGVRLIAETMKRAHEEMVGTIGGLRADLLAAQDRLKGDLGGSARLIQEEAGRGIERVRAQLFAQGRRLERGMAPPVTDQQIEGAVRAALGPISSALSEIRRSIGGLARTDGPATDPPERGIEALPEEPGSAPAAPDERRADSGGVLPQPSPGMASPPDPAAQSSPARRTFPGDQAVSRLRRTVSRIDALRRDPIVSGPWDRRDEGEALPVRPFDLEPVEGSLSPADQDFWEGVEASQD